MAKAFKRYSAAKAHAEGKWPILRVDGIYVVVDGLDVNDTGLASVEMIHPADGGITASVTLRHFERLGNANWATETKPYGGEKIFEAAKQPRS